MPSLGCIVMGTASSGAVVPPHWTVSVLAVESVFTAHTHMFSWDSVPARAVCMSVPGEEVATTLMGLPFVDSDTATEGAVPPGGDAAIPDPLGIYRPPTGAPPAACLEAVIEAMLAG